MRDIGDAHILRGADHAGAVFLRKHEHGADIGQRLGFFLISQNRLLANELIAIQAHAAEWAGHHIAFDAVPCLRAVIERAFGGKQQARNALITRWGGHDRMRAGIDVVVGGAHGEVDFAQVDATINRIGAGDFREDVAGCTGHNDVAGLAAAPIGGVTHTLGFE